MRPPIVNQYGIWSPGIGVLSRTGICSSSYLEEAAAVSASIAQSPNSQVPVSPSIGASALSAPSPAPLPVIPLAGTTITANSASKYVVHTQTLVLGGPPISVSGTAVSLVPSATAVVVAGSSTINFAPNRAYRTLEPPVNSLLPTTLTANSAS